MGATSANGNLLWSGYTYDVENRLLTAPWEEYAYDGNNRRVWNGAALAFERVADNLYFNGRLIRSGREVVAVDRLGSVRWRRRRSTTGPTS